MINCDVFKRFIINNMTPINQKLTVAAACVMGLFVAIGMGAMPAHAQGEEQISTGNVIAAPKNLAPVAKDVLVVHLPKAQEFRLDSSAGKGTGARLLVVEDNSLPTVAISVSMKAGTLFDAQGKPGVAATTAALLTDGTASRTYDQIVAETARIGAGLSASAGPERATVTVNGMAENTDELVSLLADALQHPSFPDERLTRVKFRTNAARTQQQTNPAFLASQLTQELLYGPDTAYGHPIPTPAQINGITRDDLQAFYAAHYFNSPETIIGVAGDVKPQDIYKKLNNALGGWAGPPAALSTALPDGRFTPKESTAIYVVDRPGSAQTYLTFANISTVRTNPDYFPLLVANYILGGNFSSRLNIDLREAHGYTYGVNSGVSTYKYPGLWTMGGSVRNAVTGPSIDRFFIDMSDIQQQRTVTDAEMAIAKRAIIGRFALTLENPSAILSDLIDVVNYGLPADYWDTYPQHVQAVTAADVSRVIQKYIGTGRIQLVAVGDRASIEPGLSKHGPVTIVTPAQILAGEVTGSASTAPAPASTPASLKGN